MKTNHDVIEHLMRLMRMLRRSPDGHHHLPRSMYRMLGIVCANEGIRTLALAEALDIRPSSMTELLDKGEKFGHIERRRDADDSRVMRVYPTAKAKNELAALGDIRAKQAAWISDCLCEDEAETLCVLCDKLCAYLEQQSAQHNDGGAL